jgi:hypothetical protein
MKKFSIIILIIFIMAETWGMEAKSATDPETIEEAIARLIAVHEADSSSHLGAGESLEAHKSSDVIDHLVGSVVNDKYTMTEFSIVDDFRTITQWNKTGTVSNADWPSLSLYVEYGAVNTSKIEKEIEIPTPYLSTAYNSLFQVMARFDMSNTYFKSWLGVGLYSETPSDGFGFVIVNNVLKACMARSSSITYSDPITIDLTSDHIYRAQLNADDEKIYFYIDGTLVATLDTPASSWDYDGGPTIGITLTQENDGKMWLADLNFSRAII